MTLQIGDIAPLKELPGNSRYYLRFISRYEFEVVCRCDIVMTFDFKQHSFAGVHNRSVNCHENVGHIAFGL